MNRAFMPLGEPLPIDCRHHHLASRSCKETLACIDHDSAFAMAMLLEHMTRINGARVSDLVVLSRDDLTVASARP
jgi:hypothetical protein